MLTKRRKAERQGEDISSPLRSSVVVEFPHGRQRSLPPTLRAAEPDENVPGSGWRRVLLLIALAVIVAIVLAGELSRLPLFRGD